MSTGWSSEVELGKGTKGTMIAFDRAIRLNALTIHISRDRLMKGDQRREFPRRFAGIVFV